VSEDGEEQDPKPCMEPIKVKKNNKLVNTTKCGAKKKMVASPMTKNAKCREKRFWNMQGERGV